jgi:hypothetical protein
MRNPVVTRMIAHVELEEAFFPGDILRRVVNEARRPFQPIDDLKTRVYSSRELDAIVIEVSLP